ncbi:MAG: hypothetical protein KAU17_05010 [Spirochaetales bacterium]|nr:hypothetical protein [Spirochaetales bacterium]
MPQGKGLGNGGGQGGGRNSLGGGRGRNSGGGFGSGGYCVCAGCGNKTPHTRGIKCTDLRCPACGKAMIREELLERRSK